MAEREGGALVQAGEDLMAGSRGGWIVMWRCLALGVVLFASPAMAHEWKGAARDYPFLASGTPGDVLEGKKTVPEVVDNHDYIAADVFEWLAHLSQAMVDEHRAMMKEHR